MSFMKYLSPYSGKHDPESWIEQYQAAAKAEKWTEAQMLECMPLKLKRRAKQWYEHNLSGSKPTSWEQFLTLFLEEFGDEDLQSTLARCYKIAQKKSESLKHYFSRFQKYLKKHDSVVRRELAIRYAKTLAEKTRPLIPDPNVIKKEKEDFYAFEKIKLAMSETSRVETFISGLKHYRSHFLIMQPSTMEEVRKIISNITKKKGWSKRQAYSDSESDSESSSGSDDDSDSSDSELDLENLKLKAQMGLKRRKDKERNSKPITDLNKNSRSDNKQAIDIDDLVKQFGEMKIMLSEIAKNSSKSNMGQTPFCRACRKPGQEIKDCTSPCRNCQGNGHLAQDCKEPCKICRGNNGIHPFFQCPEFKPYSRHLKPPEHITLMEDEELEVSSSSDSCEVGVV